MYIVNPVQYFKLKIERILHKRAVAHRRLKKTHSGCLIYTIRSFGAMSGPFEEADDYEYWGKRVGVFIAAAVKVVVN